MKSVCIVTCLFVIVTFHAKHALCDFKLPKGWVDPGNMLTFDPVLKKNTKVEDSSNPIQSDQLLKKSHAAGKMDSVCTAISSDLVLKKFVAFLLNGLSTVGEPPNHTEYVAKIMLEEEKWADLKRYLENSDALCAQDVLTTLQDSFKHFSPSQPYIVRKSKEYCRITVDAVGVLAIAISEFFLEPLVHLGTPFSKSFNNMFSEPPVQLWVLVLSFVFIPIIAFLLLRKSTGYVRPLYSTPPTTPLTSPLTTPNTEANPLPDNGSIVEERRLQQEQPDVTSSPSNSSAFQASLPFYVASMSSSDSSTSSFASANPPSFQASDLDGEDLPVSPLEGGDAVRVRRYPPEGDTSFSGNYQHHFQSFPHRPCQVDGETDTLTGASGSPPPYTPTDIRNQSGFRGNGCQRGPNEEASRTSEERLRTRQVVEDVEVNRGSILPTHPSADLQYSSSEYFPSTIEAESFN